MAVSERSRHELQRRLEEVLGYEHAVVLMDHLPMGEPATKADLDAVEQRLGLRIDRLELRIDGLDTRIDGLKRNIGELNTGMGALEARLNERIDLKTESAKNELRALMHEGFGAVHEQFGLLRTDMAAQTRVYFFSTVGALISVAAVMVAALQLL